MSEELKTVTLTVELTYDAATIHGNDPEAVEWFNSEVLGGPDLLLHSNEIGDTIGTVRVIDRPAPASAPVPDAQAALCAAVGALYFDDSSDYASALWAVVREIGGPDLERLMENDPAEAYRRVKAAAPAAPAAPAARESGAQEVYQLGCKMYGPAFGEQGRMYWIDCDKATYETERMAGGPCRVIAGTVARVECECGDVYPASAFKCDNCSASEPVTQGGGVDAEKVMAHESELRYEIELLDGTPANITCYGSERDMKRLRSRLEFFHSREAELRALLASPAGQGWIPVSERLPENGQSVAFIVNAPNNMHHGAVLGGTFIYHGKGMEYFAVPGSSYFASHWQPLPTPPAIANQWEVQDGR